MSVFPDELVHKFADAVDDVRGVMMSCKRYYDLLRLRDDAIVWRLDTKYRLEYLPPKVFHLMRFDRRDVIVYGNVELIRQCARGMLLTPELLITAIYRQNIVIFAAVLDRIIESYAFDPATREYGTPSWCNDVIVTCLMEENVAAFCELYKRFPLWRAPMNRRIKYSCAPIWAETVAKYMR
jgi:hypothetical protein